MDTEPRPSPHRHSERSEESVFSVVLRNRKGTGVADSSAYGLRMTGMGRSSSLCGARHRPRKVHFALFPPDGENALRSLARPLPTKGVPPFVGPLREPRTGVRVLRLRLRMSKGGAQNGRGGGEGTNQTKLDGPDRGGHSFLWGRELNTPRPSRSCAWRACRRWRRCRPGAPAPGGCTGR